MKLLWVLPLVLLTACGGGSSAGDDDSLAAGGGIRQADDDLVVDVDLGDGSAPVTWTLTCAGAVEGSHPQAEAACAHLQGLEQPFAPLPSDAICTEQYGGPQTARVTGQWGGEPVELQLARTNGCEISQWESLVPLVPAVS